MTIVIRQSAKAVCPLVRASFLATGGEAPYLYEVEPGGAGGSIDPASGAYTAPSGFSSDVDKLYDVIRVTDYDGAVQTARILVGSPLMLFCDIIQTYLGLANGRVYLWDQKIMQPSDAGLYVAVAMPAANPIGSSNRFNGTTNQSEQFVAMQGVIDVDLISRDSSARDRKEELILAFNSDYSRRQQDANSFSIALISTRFTNLSEVDGAAIPYRYKATVKILYSYRKNMETSYFNDFVTQGAIDTQQAFDFQETEPEPEPE